MTAIAREQKKRIRHIPDPFFVRSFRDLRGSHLVVETVHFDGGLQMIAGSVPDRLVERFTRVGETIQYAFTVEDPKKWVAPWTAAVPLTKTEAPLFEYACHEGNYAMVNILAGARAGEKAAATRR